MPLLATLWVYATVLLAGALLGAALSTRAGGSGGSGGIGSPGSTEGAGRIGRTGLLARAILLGPAAITLTMLALHLVGVPFSLAAITAPWWLAALFGRRALGRGLAPLASGRSPLRRGFTVGALVLGGLALVIGLRVPVYSGDGIDNVAAAARVYETSARFDFEALERLPGVGGASYPPLVAATEALVFLAAGDQRMVWIKPLFALTWLAWLLLVIELAFTRLPPRAAALMAAPFLALPMAAGHALIGYTDLHLTALLLLLCLELRDPLGLALVAGACALTKNEGLALAGASGLLLTLRALRPGDGLAALGSAERGGEAATGAASARPSALAVAGCLGLLAVMAGAWPLLKLWHGVGFVHLSGGAAWSWSELASRSGDIARAFGAGILGAPQGRWSFHAPLALALVLLAVGAAPARALRGVGPWVGLFSAHVALYAVVLVRHPLGSDWQASVAADRLMLHTTPWLLLAAVASLHALLERSGGRAPEPASPTA